MKQERKAVHSSTGVRRAGERRVCVYGAVANLSEPIVRIVCITRTYGAVATCVLFAASVAVYCGARGTAVVHVVLLWCMCTAVVHVVLLWCMCTAVVHVVLLWCMWYCYGSTAVVLWLSILGRAATRRRDGITRDRSLPRVSSRNPRVCDGSRLSAWHALCCHAAHA